MRAAIAKAEAGDRAEMQETLRKIARTPDDVADFMIAEFEASTGLTASAEDIAEARRMVRNGDV